MHSAVAQGRFSYRLLCGFFLTVAIVPSFSGHDFQRVCQVLFGLCTLVFMSSFFARSRLRMPEIKGALIPVLSILVLGLLSSVLADKVSWAFAEYSLLILGVLIASSIALLRNRESEPSDRYFILYILLLCTLKIVQFLASGVAAFSFNTGILDTDTLLQGFSNKRFYGQFQTFTLPLLALPLLIPALKHPAKMLVFSLLSGWWLIAITGGTRGTWLGMGVAAAVLAITGPSGRRWVAWQLAAMLCGLLLYWLLFSVLTGYLGIEVQNFAGDRMTTSLSGRELIWWQAWDMTRQRPLLGFGPMHFADIANPVAAHPHQAILQWASEWGVPSTLLVGWLVLRGLHGTFKLVGDTARSALTADLLRVCLFASVLGALAQSMVDGVLVMPYSQLWLAIVVGWLMALHVWKVHPVQVHPLVHWGWVGISVAATAWLMFVVIRDAPHLGERNERYAKEFGSYFQPRFWAQGIIAQRPE